MIAEPIPTIFNEDNTDPITQPLLAHPLDRLRQLLDEDARTKHLWDEKGMKSNNKKT